MKMSNKKQGVLENVIWKFAERIGAQLITLIVSIVLARILSPEHYGTISIILIFINIANVFVSNGFTASLIQKKDSDELDFNTIFYFNIAFSFVLYGVIFVVAPMLETFFELKHLGLALRILGIKIPITAFNSIQQTYVAKHMMFKKIFWATLGGTIVSAFVGIWMALNNYGVFALVGQYLSNGIIDTIMLWIVIKWRPKFQFSFERFKILFGFGWKVLLTYLVRTIYDDIYSFAIGKKYSSADLAYYTKGKQYPNLFVSNLNTSICAVLFPAFSKYQDDMVKMKEALRRSISMSLYLLSPFLIGLAITAKPVIELLLTEKWLECVPYMQIVCVYQLLIPISSANLQVIKSMGRSKVLLALEIIKRVFGLALLLVSMRFGVMAIAIGAAIATFFNCILDIAANCKLLNYSFLEQMKDILYGSVTSVFMGVSIYFFKFLITNSLLLLLVQVSTGVVAFVSFSFLTKNKNFLWLIQMSKEKFFASKNKTNIDHASE